MSSILIQSKLTVPTGDGRAVARPRLSSLIRELHERHRVVWVIATAGAGKTTAVTGALSDGPRPAWLTLDTPDGAPGRLLTYLEAALREAVPGMAEIAREALADGVHPSETAGLLAQALAQRPVSVVIDELERIANAPAALDVLSAFLRYTGPCTRIILISRRVVDLAVPTSASAPQVATVSESDLAFTIEEARVALATLGRDGVDPAEAVNSTGGWVAGVLFEAWRSAGHVYGAGGEADPLRGYLSTEIMSDLSDEEQTFLIHTSVLSEVTPARADALGLPAAAERLAGLRTRHLPVTFAATGLSMRCHPRFREYLRDQLSQRPPAQVRETRRAYARLLGTEGRNEEAAEELLAIGSLEAAEAVIERAVLDVIARGDISVAERWLSAIAERRIEGSRELTEARLRVALSREEYGVGAGCADRLLAMLAVDDGVRLTPGLAGAIAWCYFLVCRIDDARAVLADSPSGSHREIMSFAVGVDVFGDPIHYRDRPRDSGDQIDNMLARIDLLHGRFAKVVERPVHPWTRSSYIGALRAMGRLDEALALFHESTLDDWTTVRMYVELMADLNRPQEAWTALIDGRPLLERAGSPVFRMFALLLEVMLALRFDQNTTLARAALAAVEREPTALQRIRAVEQIEMWRGLIALLEDDPELAVAHLRRAVEIMVTWDRLLYLTDAAVYLAEAEWRLGNEDAADAAARLARDSAAAQGSDHLLLGALRRFPAVVSRSIDAEPEPDSRWHALGRVLQAEEVLWHADLVPRVRLLEFGQPALLVDGQESFPKLAKSIELLSFLALHQPRVSRAVLLEELFDGRTDDSSRAYVRMAINKLRAALPADAPFVADAEQIRWLGGGLTSESTELVATLQQARETGAHERLGRIAEALRPLERGEFLPQVTSRWAEVRREELREIVNDARQSAAEAAYETGDYLNGEAFVQRLLDDDPFRESVWRLQMRLASALGNDDRVLAAFRSCETALRKVGFEPAEATRRLVEQLRR